MSIKYYDGTKLLSLKDLDNGTPEIYMIVSNRSAGKTTYFNRLAVNRWKKKQIRKFAILYRYNYELTEVSDKFFKDIGALFFPNDTMTSVSMSKGIYHSLLLNDVECGYAISINNADQIKKMSHLFSDIDMMIFDEFQSETSHYCPDEIRKFLSIHTSIARGQGNMSRYVPVYMISNPVTLLNPYYVELGIAERLRENTRFLRGNGWVLEYMFNESASKALESSAFNRAFSKNSYMSYATQAVYLNDNKAFIERPCGESRYLCTLKYNGVNYSIREYATSGFLYVDTTYDESFRLKINVTTEDHNINYVMLRRNDFIITNFRKYFELGCFRFKDMKCKDALLKALSY